MSTDIDGRIKQVVAEQIGGYGVVALTAESLKAGDRLVDDLGADSLDLVELVMALEDEFAIVIDDYEAEKVQTVQQAIDFVKNQLAAA